jgi:hypothetical protein
MNKVAEGFKDLITRLFQWFYEKPSQIVTSSYQIPEELDSRRRSPLVATCAHQAAQEGSLGLLQSLLNMLARLLASSGVAERSGSPISKELFLQERQLTSAGSKFMKSSAEEEILGSNAL